MKTNSLPAIGLALAATIGLSTAAVLAHPQGHGSDRDHHDDVADKQVERTQEEAVIFARNAASEARRTGNTLLLRDAERALEPWDNAEEASSALLIVRANIKQIDHKFDSALADLDTVIEREPGNPQALLSRAFIKATTGDAASGLADCAQLRPYVPLTVRETCVSRLAGLAGFLDEAKRRMVALITIAPGTEPQLRTFALAVGGELAERAEDFENALRFYEELHSSNSESVFAKAALADLLLKSGDTARATEVIGEDPQTEALLLLSALAGKEARNPVSLRSAAELRSRMDVDLAAGDFSHGREYARFALDYLEDAPLALMFAQRNWEAQKEPIDAVTLARAAIEADEPDVLTQLKEWVARTRLESPELARLIDGNAG